MNYVPDTNWKSVTSAVMPQNIQGDGPPSDAELSLFIFEKRRSTPFLLPNQGKVLIGRRIPVSELDERVQAERNAYQCVLELDDPAVSRRHAQLVIENGEAHFEDLKSINGSRINNRAASASCVLVDGDAISIQGSHGELYLLIFRRKMPRNSVSRFADLSFLRQQIDQMLIARAQSHSPFALIALSLSTAFDEDQPFEGKLDTLFTPEDTVARLAPDLLIILRSNDDEQEATAHAQEMIATLQACMQPAKASVATFPNDGTDGEVLLSAVADAALTAKPGEVGTASRPELKIELADHTVLAADSTMVQTYELLRRLANSNLVLLICGETGTGKEMAAQAVHHWSGRKGDLIAKNCATIVESLAPATLEGAVKGSYTGVDSYRPGIFEAAKGGTVFLDEIGELSLENQARLLRILDTKEVTPVGSAKSTRIDFRLIAATNRNLEEEVAAKRFRADLFARLNGGQPIPLPPLRNRRRELPILARQFTREAAVQNGRSPKVISPAAMHLITSYDWPLNVRELKQTIERAVVTTDGDVILPQHLGDIGSKIRSGRSGFKPPAAQEPKFRPIDQEKIEHLYTRLEDSLKELDRLRQQVTSITAPARVPAEQPGFKPIDKELEALERRRMVEALNAACGVKTRAAKFLLMPLSRFKDRFAYYQIQPEEYASSRDPGEAED
ncbi:MAG: sigma 54-interacting transcriptional regulator [Polyangia bacterium]